MAGNPIPYAGMRKEFSEHAVRRSEVPVEHWISLPMPTRRWAVPGYAGLACPALRAPRQPLRLRQPDRWWLLGASHGELLAYARTSVLPFVAAPDAPTAETVTVPPSARLTAAAVLEDRRVLDETMERVIGPFFVGEPGDAALRADLITIIGLQAGAPEVLAWYQALAPDFFR